MTGILRDLRRAGTSEEAIRDIIKEINKRTDDITADEELEYLELMLNTEGHRDDPTVIETQFDHPNNEDGMPLIMMSFHKDERTWLSQVPVITVQNNPAFVTTKTDMIYGGGLQFAAANSQRIEIDDSSFYKFGASTNFTFGIFYKGSSSDMYLIFKGNIFTNKFYALGIDINGKVFAEIHDGTTSKKITGTTSINNNVKHSIVSALNRAGNMTLYVDGILEGTIDISSVGNIDDTNKLYIGCRFNNTVLEKFANGILAHPFISSGKIFDSIKAIDYNNGILYHSKTVIYLSLAVEVKNECDNILHSMVV